MKKGEKMSLKARKHLSQIRIGMKFSEEHKRHIGDSKRGEKHPNFDMGFYGIAPKREKVYIQII